MNNYMVSFRNGPTVMVRATCVEGARIAAKAQTGRNYEDITGIVQMAQAY